MIQKKGPLGQAALCVCFDQLRRRYVLSRPEDRSQITDMPSFLRAMSRTKRRTMIACQ